MLHGLTPLHLHCHGGFRGRQGGKSVMPFRIAGLDPALSDPGGNGKFGVGASTWEDH